jgi:hypothetical protein
MDGEQALEQLLAATERYGIYREEQCRRLALQWPSLAAALANLLAAHDRPVPRALRMAANVAREVAVPSSQWCQCSAMSERHRPHKGVQPREAITDD